MTNLRASLDDLDYAHREHIRSLVDWLLSEVCFAGGDGDAIWIVRNLDIFKLRAFVQDECMTNKDQRHWTISDVKPTKNGHRFSLSNNQEALVITTDPEDVPPWSQCTVTC